MDSVITFIVYLTAAAGAACLINFLSVRMMTVIRQVSGKTEIRRDHGGTPRDVPLSMLQMALRLLVLVLSFYLFRTHSLKMIAVASGFLIVIKLQLVMFSRKLRAQGRTVRAQNVLQGSDLPELAEAKGDALYDSND